MLYYFILSLYHNILLLYYIILYHIMSYHKHILSYRFFSQVDEMQHISFEYARKADKELAKKLRNKHDTRAAAVVQQVKSRSMFSNEKKIIFCQL